jgi:hemolysin activation/secretion protein
MGKNKKHLQITAGVLYALLLPSVVWAAPAVNVPDAGSLTNITKPQIQDKKPLPNVQVEHKEQDAAKKNDLKILVKNITVQGQNVISPAKLEPLYKDKLGKELTFTELSTIADSLANYFHKHGYPVATAYLPVQTVENGQVTIKVAVGNFGKILLINKSGLIDSVANNYLGHLKNGETVKGDKLDRTVLLLNDLNGVKSKATLQPGTKAGTVDLLMELENDKKIDGYFSVDNWGNRYTGHNRAWLNLNLNNFTEQGDKLSAGGVYNGSWFKNFDFRYEVPIGGTGMNAGVSYSHLDYELAKELETLNGYGSSRDMTYWLSYPWARSRNFNFNTKLFHVHRDLYDVIDLQNYTSRKRSDALGVSLNGDSMDNLWGGGFNSFDITYLGGHLGMQSKDANYSDVYDTAGKYHKLNYSLTRLQNITNRLSNFLYLRGQRSSKNLDSSEKLTVGGPTGVRAYGVNSALGDEGYVFTDELRWNMPNNNLQLAAFYDNGKVIYNKDEFSGVDDRNQLIGAGLGIIFSKSNDYYIRIDHAWTITDTDKASANGSGSRWWVQALKFF